MSDGKPRVLLLGDTILNLSYVARPLREGEWRYPYSYFNEEYLETDSEPEATLQVSMSKGKLGFRVTHEDVAAAELVQGKEGMISDEESNVFARMLTAVGETPICDGDVIRPKGGSLDKHLTALEDALTRWKPRKGRDLIAIFGESRSGKEYPLGKLLEAHGYEPVGPVNMQRFLAETDDILIYLTKNENRKRVLLLDEIVEESAARPLLNLMAEKKYTSYRAKMRDIDFKEHMVIIMSSMEKDRLLPDLRGRLSKHLVNPPLRERTDEIPYLIPICLKNGLGNQWDEPQTFKISLRLFSALLRHDYRSIESDLGPEEEDAGLDQMNFRALEDLLAFLYKRCPESDRFLKFTQLPERLRNLLSNSESDEEYLMYRRDGKGRYPISRHSA